MSSLGFLHRSTRIPAYGHFASIVNSYGPCLTSKNHFRLCGPCIAAKAGSYSIFVNICSFNIVHLSVLLHRDGVSGECYIDSILRPTSRYMLLGNTFFFFFLIFQICIIYSSLEMCFITDIFYCNVLNFLVISVIFTRRFKAVY